MFAFIMGIAGIVIAAGLTVAAVTAATGRKVAWAGGAVAAVACALLLLAVSTLRSVPVHSVGVETSFGKIESSLRPGVHWFVAPWTSVQILDETVQTDQFYGNSRGGSCMQVRIGGQQLACLNITVKWQVEDPAAPQLFNQYDNPGTKIMTSLNRNLVINDLRAVTNQVMGDYNPIADVTLTANANLASKTATTQSQFSTFGPLILREMRSDLKGQIRVLTITLQNAYYNATTEGRLASVANQFADTAAAQEQIQTDTNLAKANTALAKSLTPQIVENNCITATTDIIKTGGKLPAGWSCSGSSAVVAGG